MCRRQRKDQGVSDIRPVDLESNPFAPEGGRPEVFVTGGEGPYANARKALACIDLSAAKGKRVLLKPNAGRIASADSGIVTNPEVLAAAIDAFREAGADVAVGESPITGVKALEALESCGIAGVSKDRNCPLIDLDAKKFIEVEIPNGKAITMIKACTELQEFDIVVSIPVMKNHMHTGVTLAVKNMKGCLWGRSKIDLHMLPQVEGYDDKMLDVAISDMSSVLRPHLAIIDGTIGMEGLGPSAGDPKPADVIVVGADAFAADAVACRLMDRRAEDVPHLRMGAERGFGIIDIDKIDVSPNEWMDLACPFAPVPDNLSLKVPGMTILDENSCSGCQSTLLMFLKRYGKEVLDYFPDERPFNVAIGKGHEALPPRTLCIGGCTKAHKDVGIYVPGCPPVASAILNAVKAARDDQKAE